jgi:signal transduction histidine kinase
VTFPRAVFQRLGSPDAVTWIAFWVCLTFALIANLITPGQEHYTILQRVPAVIFSEVAMFAPLLLLKWYLLKNSGKPHPWLVLSTFILAPILRGALLGWILYLFGGSSSISVGSRISSSFMTNFLSLLITALVVTNSRALDRDRAELFQLRDNLNQTQSQISTQIQERNEAALHQVKSTLKDQLQRLESANQTETLRQLEHLANDVVRPLSHELAASVPHWSPRQQDDVHTKVSMSAVVHELTKKGAFLPLLTGLVTSAVVIPASLTPLPDQAIKLAAITALGIPLVFFITNFALDRLQPRKTFQRSLATFIAITATASALPAVCAGLAVGDSRGVAYAFAGTALVGFIAILLAVIRVVLTEQRVIADEIRESGAQLKASLVRLNQLQWFHQRALARALHGAMQSAVHAAAMQLDQGLREGEVPGSLIDDLRSQLIHEVNVLSASSPTNVMLQEVVTRIVTLWSRIITIDVHANDEVHAAVDTDPVLCSAVSEILAEAVSNSIRHGHATTLSVSLTLPGANLLNLVVQDNGKREGPNKSEGMGSRLLNDCTVFWEVNSSLESQRLFAQFPIGI